MDEMSSWRTEGVDTLFEHRLFALERHRLERGRREPDRSGPGQGSRAAAEHREAMVLRAPDWVNVIATEGEEVLLVRQWRFGLREPTLEIPGGMVEGESERAAAERELLEETGYRAGGWRRLGAVHPNPAFLTNLCGTWLATDLELQGPPEGDGEEEIEVTRAPLARIPELIRDGTITHALVIAAFHLLELDRG